MTDLVAYPLPKLSNADVSRGISDLLHIEFADTNLVKPESPTIRYVYEKIVESFLGISLENYGDPSFSDYTSFEYPNLHEESVTEATFLRYLYVAFLMSQRN